MTCGLLFFFCSHGQITKSNWLVGGSASFNSLNMESPSGEGTVRQLRVEPNIGYFFADKVAGGLRGYLNYEKSSSGSNSASNTSFGFGPFARYYFLPVTNQGNIFLDAAYKFYFNNPGDDNAKGYAIKAGSVLFFNTSVGLEFSVGYSFVKRESDIKYKEVIVGIGFQIHLEK